MRKLPSANRRLPEYLRRALNKIKKPSTVEEITEVLNRDLGPGDHPFQPEQVTTSLRSTRESVLHLYWLVTRPRR